MGWMERLYETYENCKDLTDITADDSNSMLLPMGHTILKAHITVSINGSGGLLDAFVDEDINGTIAPCTEDSESRSGINPVSHPLFDKLQYLAGDFEKYVAENKRHFYDKYIQNLESWCRSIYSNNKVTAILNYLKKESLITDLVEKKVFYLNDKGMLLDKWEGDKEAAPAVFRIKNMTPSEAIIRFTVDIDVQNKVWMDTKVRQSFIDYYFSSKTESGLCYVSGRNIPLMEKHPKNIVSIMANAKLISANDNTGYTFRGRFSESGQALSIGGDTSIKAHNALRWLIKTRGFFYKNSVIMAWETKGKDIPQPGLGTEEFKVSDVDDVEDENAADVMQRVLAETGYVFSKNFKKAIRGYKSNLKHTDISVIILGSATPGRLSISYYREMKGDEYIGAIEKWHTSCLWKLEAVDKEGKKYSFIGAPSLKDISDIAYGINAGDKLKKATLERLIPCVIDGVKIPSDLVNMVVRRASNPMTMEKWEWNRILGIACALYNKLNEQEGYQLGLEEDRNDRDYLYGRLLAVADGIEGYVLYKSNEKRETNAMRYMNAFSQKPFHVWKIIEERVNNYLSKLEESGNYYYKDLMTQIISSFLKGEFENNSRLSGSYLLGYHCQRQVFIDKMKEAATKKNAEKTK